MTVAVDTNRLRALDLANNVRKDRALVRRMVRIGTLSLVDLIEHPPASCAKVAVFDILQWKHGVGISRARRAIRGVTSETLPLCLVGAGTREQLLGRVAKLETGVRR